MQIATLGAARAAPAPGVTFTMEQLVAMLAAAKGQRCAMRRTIVRVLRSVWRLAK